jgi:preprotein translocase subunit SecA
MQADSADAYAKSRTGRSMVASFAADPAIFPCQLSAATLAAGKAASKAAAAAWGERSLPLLEAEDRLSVACEKGSTDDEVLLKLRAVYQVRPVGMMLLEHCQLVCMSCGL